MTIIDDIARVQRLGTQVSINGDEYPPEFNEILLSITSKINADPVQERFAFCQVAEELSELPRDQKYPRMMAILADCINMRCNDIKMVQHSLIKWVPPIVLESHETGELYPNIHMTLPVYSPHHDIIINLPNAEIYLPYGFPCIPLCKDSMSLLLDAFNYYQHKTDNMVYKVFQRRLDNSIVDSPEYFYLNEQIVNLLINHAFCPETVFIPTAYIENYGNPLTYQTRIIRKYMRDISDTNENIFKSGPLRLDARQIPFKMQPL